MKNKTITKWVASICLAVITTLSTNAAGYIKFDGIEGESRATGHKGWSDIMSFSQGIHQPGGGKTGATRRRSSAVFQDLVVVKELDKSSPKIAESVATGRVFPRVVLEMTARTDSGEITYYSYELTNALVKSYQISADNPNLLPVENFSLNFEEIKVTYTGLEFDSGDKPKEGTSYSWKVEEGESLK
ncbi:MAG: type VI secretion system tube protein Hcp [Verrucomicrobia bacterium]|jgi:type VI secretion system secreted protein Hcp|nr:type VI secretion system tube protein Hcp [Verrucomicrobiota bacterium]